MSGTTGGRFSRRPRRPHLDGLRASRGRYRGGTPRLLWQVAHRRRLAQPEVAAHVVQAAVTVHSAGGWRRMSRREESRVRRAGATSLSPLQPLQPFTGRAGRRAEPRRRGRPVPSEQVTTLEAVVTALDQTRRRDERAAADGRQRLLRLPARRKPRSTPLAPFPFRFGAKAVLPRAGQQDGG